MKKPTLFALLALAGCSTPTGKAPPPAVVAAPVPTIAAGLAALPALATLAAGVKAAGLAETLAGPGPFTVFAPTDAAFARLAPGTVDTLLKPENKPALTKLLTYHVVPGTLTTADLTARVAAGGGTATLVTVAGDPLTLTITDGHLTLTDAGGNKSYVETGDVRQANGVVHLVNGVVVPKLD